MGNLNIEEIMKEIRKEIEEKGFTYDMLSFDDIVVTENSQGVYKFDRNEFNKELFQLNVRWEINPNREIEKKKGLKGWIASLYKKIVRKSIRFYVSSIVDDQNLFNASTVRLLGMLNIYTERNDALEKEVEKLKKDYEILEEKIKKLSYKED